jgi:hypothetical protein
MTDEEISRLFDAIESLGTKLEKRDETLTDIKVRLGRLEDRISDACVLRARVRRLEILLAVVASMVLGAGALLEGVPLVVGLIP